MAVADGRGCVLRAVGVSRERLCFNGRSVPGGGAVFCGRSVQGNGGCVLWAVGARREGLCFKGCRCQELCFMEGSKTTVVG